MKCPPYMELQSKKKKRGEKKEVHKGLPGRDKEGEVVPPPQVSLQKNRVCR